MIHRKDIEVRLLRKQTEARPAQYLVKYKGEEAGILEKYKDTPTETHPWKAFWPIGFSCEMIQHWYGRLGKWKCCEAVIKKHLGVYHGTSTDPR